jgi:hypothetical protein
VRGVCVNPQKGNAPRLFLGVWDHSVPGPKADLITSRGRDLAFVPIGSYEIPLRA